MFAFTGARGDRLAGRLDIPDGKLRAVVLVAHCFGDANAGPVTARFARGFSELGMAVLSLACAPAAALGVAPDDLALAAADLPSSGPRPTILRPHSLPLPPPPPTPHPARPPPP